MKGLAGRRSGRVADMVGFEVRVRGDDGEMRKTGRETDDGWGWASYGLIVVLRGRMSK